ncbi:hepatocyte growth factor [Gadus chalcogrammus]|uniref:hepatocyte growth factor n=1 Tax=Gadus chalcogrammus TaxID=1042646 RepID=UPI0024C4B150|nr:hepatocyte growth factor [Gadus chalcogrammus]
MWMYNTLIGLFIVCCCESRRNALQDYQTTDGVGLTGTPADPISLSKRKMSVAKCAKACNRPKKFPFTCRAFVYDHRNRKCQWLSFDRNTHAGVQSQEDSNYQLYQKKDYVRECIVGTGVNYRGQRSVTVGGIPCQAWASPLPHEHKFMSKRYRNKDLRDNLCRNPDNSTVGPWCFTTDPRPHLRHQGCGVPQCSEVACVSCNGEDYRGPMDHTQSGRECQRWDLQEPHTHLHQPKSFQDKGLDDNFCRNPDARHRPWCYTTDPHTPWEYCDIKVCNTARESTVAETTLCSQGGGEGYRGTADMGPDGRTCQRWDVQYPHNHTFTPQDYPCKDLEENYCRNPDGQESPWCFTTDPRVRTTFCTNIPQCGVQSDPAVPQDCYEGLGAAYQGRQSRTRSNLPCSAWKEHSNSDRRMSTVDMEAAYCRNPDEDKHGPWCYTNTSSVPWDYCSVQPCEASQHTLPQVISTVGCFIHKRIRIVGGGTPNISDGSWMVSIQKGSRHWCGGSLIREEWVLTDRQCFSSCVPDLSEYQVWLGVSDLREEAADWSTRQEISIAHVICGPEGSSLALIRLARPAHPAQNVRTVQLPVAGCTIPNGKMCKVYGWGETKGTGHDDVLKVVDLPVVHNDQCRQLHRGSLHISERNICAGGRRNEGVCEGDYGGPLVCQDGESKVIVGVSVHGRSCARADQPSIFINVPFYTQWIYKVFKYYPEQQTF